MPILPPGNPGTTPAPPGQTTFRVICTNAFYEINVVAPGENPDESELAFALDKANRLADLWSAQKIYIYASQLLSAAPNAGANFLLQAGLSPHTIGPATANPTFPVLYEAPVRIKNINIILNNVTPVVRFPLTKRDSDWWATNRLQAIQTALPTDFYYRRDWPAGSIFFWPVPNRAYGAEVEVETIIPGGVTLDTIYTVPAGYEEAFTLTLAELLCPSFEKQPNAVLINAALLARNAVKGLNNGAPRISLDDFGDSSSARPRASFNYRTGMSR
jgi:hypothetical protein